jgi:DNA-binding LacI/PurR family transcriptional regulator
MVTQSDVAELAGVSFITVSRVINDKGNVKPETRKKVEAAIKKLGYYPSGPGRALNSNRTRVIGFSVPDAVNNVFVIDVLRGIQNACTREGYSLFLIFNDPEGEKADIFRPYFERKVDGLVLFTPGLTKEQESVIRKNSIPCSVLWEESGLRGVQSFFPDEQQGARLAIEHLIELGHRRIAVVAGTKGNRSSDERMKGVKKTLKKHGLTLPPEYVCSGIFSRGAGYRHGQHFLGLADPPTAVFCFNDDTAAGLIGYAAEKGVKVPEELSIAGFDNCSASPVTWPPLTTVQNPAVEIADAGAQDLIDRLEGRPGKKQGLFPVELVVRGSTGPAGPGVQGSEFRVREQSEF